MKHYLIELSEYDSNGCRYTQTIDTGDTEVKLDLEEIAQDYQADEDTWYIIKVSYYAPGADPLFDEPEDEDEITVQ